MKKISAVLIVFLLTFAWYGCKHRRSTSGIAWRSTGIDEFVGYSDYRLLVANPPDRNFNPNSDVLKPSPADTQREKIAEAMRSALLKSLIPLARLVGPDLLNNEHINLMDLVTSSVASGARVLKDAFLSDLAQVDLPDEQVAFLVPWPERRDNRFYSAQKISVGPSKTISVLGVTAAQPEFATMLTANIKDLIARKHKQTKTPAYLVALFSRMNLKRGAHSVQTQVLLGINPMERPFKKDNPDVVFKTAAVKDIAGHPTTACLTFNVDLEDNPKPTTLDVDFGAFSNWDRNFAMDESSREAAAPRLQGSLKKPNASWVDVEFAFRRISFDLNTLDATAVDTLVSPGFEILGERWTTGGIKMASVDKAFQDEINKSIDDEIKKFEDKTGKPILQGRLSPELMLQLLNAIFSR